MKFEAVVHLLHVVGDFSYMGGFDVAYPSIEELQNQIIASAVKQMDQVCEENLQGCPLFY